MGRARGGAKPTTNYFYSIFNANIMCLLGKKYGFMPIPLLPLIPTSVRLKFTPVGSAPDPLNQQVNHVTSHSNALQRHMLDKAVLTIMICFETEDAGKLAN